MNDEELLAFQDQLRNSLSSITGASQALGHVTDVSTDYCMCQMLSGVLRDQVDEIISSCPSEWEIRHPGF